MTITRESYMQEYEIATADGERVEFPFEFSAIGAGTIHCFDIDPTLPDSDAGHEAEIPQSEFTVTAASAGLLYGGKVTLAGPVAVGHLLRIRRITPKTQNKVFRNQRVIPPEQVEEGIDKLTLIAQEAQGSSNEGTVADLDAVKQDIATLQNNKANIDYVDGKDTALSGRIDALTNTVNGKVADAPSDGKIRGRKDAAWVEIPKELPAGGNAGDLLAKTATGWEGETAASLTARLAKGTASAFGVVKADGSTIISSGGVLTAIGGGGGEGGTSNHAQLTNRDLPGQHPSSAISHGVDENNDPLPLDTYLGELDTAVAGIDAAVAALDAEKAPLDSPGFSGAPTAPTPNDASPPNQIATVEYVQNTSPSGGEPAIPVGTVLAFDGTEAPPTYVFLDGALYAKAPADATAERPAYPELYAVIGDRYTPSGTDARYFAVEDARKRFIRGTSSDLPVGTRQEDALQNITGTASIGKTGIAYNDIAEITGAFYGTSDAAYSNNFINSGTSAVLPKTLGFDASRVARTDNETRPKNTAKHWIIKAETGGISSKDDFTSAVAAVNAQLDGKQNRVDFVVGVEQWTGRYWINEQGEKRKIYRKIVNAGALLNTAAKSIPHEITSLAHVISVAAVTTNGGGVFVPIPYSDNTMLSNAIMVTITTNAINIITAANYSTFLQTYVTFEYTCSDR